MADDDPRAHRYSQHLIWEGNLGDGTADYRSYGRSWRARRFPPPESACSRLAP
jgi:hypothetical protein